MEWILQKAQKFKGWWQGLNLFGQKLPVVLAFILFVALVFHVFFEVKDSSIILKDPLQAIISDEVRNLGLLLAASIGWHFLARRTKAAEREANISEQNTETSKQNTKIPEQNIKTRYQKIVHGEISVALEQLDGKNSFIRLSGISDLEKFADTHKEEGIKVARILVSFIQKRAVKNFFRYNILAITGIGNSSTYRTERLDVEAAVKALAKITSEIEKRGQFSEGYGETKYQICDLRNTDLRGLRLEKIDLSKFNLARADMSGVSFFGTNLNGAHLVSANFSNAGLRCAKFNEAYLLNATFTGARIVNADFTDAELECVDFTDALLKEVKIEGARLKDTNLTDAELLNVQGLQQHQLDEAFRWKGHSTSVSSAEGCLLKPPPEYEKSSESE